MTMNKVLLVTMTGILSLGQSALAYNWSPKSQSIRNFLFDKADANDGMSLQQNGKTFEGSPCTLEARLSSYGVKIFLTTGDGRHVAYVMDGGDSKITTSDVQEESLSVNGLAYFSDETGHYANKQSLDIKTHPSSRRIHSIIIRTQETDDWVSRSIPDFTDASSEVSVACHFGR